jgi:hypothetical protein
MSPTGRNDPCPCGSGRKFKKCCGAATLQHPDAAYDRIRRLDGESADLLARFAKIRFGEDAIEQAWLAFWFSDDIPYETSHPEYDLFLRWFTLDWRPDDSERLAEMFLSEKGSKIDSDIRSFLSVTLAAPYSFFQTLDVTPGVSLVLRDVLRKRDFNVTERSASTILEKSNLLYARVVESEGVAFIMGSGSLVIPQTFLSTLLDLREDLEREEAETDGGISTEILLELEDDLRETYFDLADEIRNRKLDIRNTDGDPLLLHTARYDISSFERAFDALKDLELKVTHRPEKELIDKTTPAKAHIHWMKKRKTTLGEELTTIATLTLSDLTLVVDTNSEKRAKRIQKEIAKRLGDDAVYIGTEIKSTEGMLKAAAKDRGNTQQVGESEHERLMRESPAARRLVKEFMEKHWAAWPDTPLPALRGMTPRNAAKDPLGRELLESLLLSFESEAESENHELQRIDTDKLRQELGMK